MPFTAADIIILAIMLLSGLLALMRGFVREVFTVVVWVAAAFAALTLFETFSPIMRGMISIGALADGLALGIPFLISLVFLSVFSGKLVVKLSGHQPGPLDGTAGFLFGIARGFILICIVYLGFQFFYQPQAAPAWLADAKFLPLIEKTNGYFQTVSPARAEASAVTPKSKKKSSARAKDFPVEDTEDEKGYSKQERGAIDQLFQSSADR